MEQKQTDAGLGVIGSLWVALIVLKIIGYLPSLPWWIIVPFPILAVVIMMMAIIFAGALIYVLIKEK